MNMSPEGYAHVMSDLKRQEGFRSKAYLDTVGVWTIGYGFTEGVRRGDTITLAEAEEYLAERVQVAITDARRLCPVFDSLNPIRQAVVVNLAYNLGYTRLSKFKNTLAYLNAHNFVKAAAGLRSSLWCRQVKTRCDELVAELQSGMKVR